MPVYKFTDGRRGWYFSLSFRGKRYKKERYEGRSMLTKIEAQQCEFAYRQLLEAQYQESLKPAKDRILLLDAFDAYYNVKSSVLKPNSLKLYMTFKNQYLNFENKPIGTLSIEDIDSWKIWLSNSSKNKTTKNHMLGIMDDFLSWCSVHYEISQRLRIPLETKFKINEAPKVVNVYTPEEFKIFEDNLSNNFYRALFRVLFFGGLRIGELQALKVEDFDGSSITINKTFARVGSTSYIHSPKSKKGYRSVLLDSITCELLNEIKKEVAFDSFLFGIKGEPITIARINKENAEASSLAGLKKLHLHEFRKSCATMLLQLGFSPVDIAARLGHNVDVSANVYMQTDKNAQLEMIKKFN